MRDVICVIISYCALGVDMGKLSTYDQIVIKNLNKARRWMSKIFFLHKFSV